MPQIDGIIHGNIQIDALSDGTTVVNTTNILNAGNSGITAAKVSTYDGYAATIASKATQANIDSSISTYDYANSGKYEVNDTSDIQSILTDEGIKKYQMTWIGAATSYTYVSPSGSTTITLYNGKIYEVVDATSSGTFKMTIKEVAIALPKVTSSDNGNSIRVVNGEWQKQTVDTTPTTNSSNLVTSGGVASGLSTIMTAVNGKQDTINDLSTIRSGASAGATAIQLSQKGANGGVAELDSNGKVPSAQLPSYVDDVLEYNSLSDFPATGETGKIYIAKDTNKQYRWSGTAYVEISASLALGETSSTAYRGDRGKTAYDHSQVTSGNPHNVSKSDVGLDNVGNFKAVSTVANQGLTASEQSNARINIGAGTGDGTITGITMNGASKGTSGTIDLGTVITAHQSVTLASGTNNGTLKITTNAGTTDNVAVKGLGTAAYTNSTAYATSAQGTKADNAVVANNAITGATKTKITYDSKGLVTAGSDLSASDIPNLSLSKITDVTATASELNVLDGITATTTELNYTDGVTSNIQTQFNSLNSNLDNKENKGKMTIGNVEKTVSTKNLVITDSGITTTYNVLVVS